MQKKNNRYREMERYMTYALLADLALFILYLVFAATGVIWAKVIVAILTICLSLLCLAFLYLTQEILKRRSLWMSVSAAAIALCLLFSLILNIPSPNPYKDVDDQTIETTEQL